MARQRKPLFLEALTNQLINQAVTNQESRKTTKNNLKRKTFFKNNFNLDSICNHRKS